MIRRELVRIGISDEYLQALTDEQLETLSDGFRMLARQYEKLSGVALDTKNAPAKSTLI